MILAGMLMLDAASLDIMQLTLAAHYLGLSH